MIDLSCTIQEIFELGENARKPDSLTLQQDDRKIIMHQKKETESTLESEALNSPS